MIPTLQVGEESVAVDGIDNFVVWSFLNGCGQGKFNSDGYFVAIPSAI
jgi:hypothetical protein